MHSSIIFNYLQPGILFLCLPRGGTCIHKKLNHAIKLLDMDRWTAISPLLYSYSSCYFHYNVPSYNTHDIVLSINHHVKTIYGVQNCVTSLPLQYDLFFSVDESKFFFSLDHISDAKKI